MPQDMRKSAAGCASDVLLLYESCLYEWMSKLIQAVLLLRQVSTSFDLDDARRSYFGSLFPLNPGGIIPVGPTLADLGLDRDPGRGPRQAEAIFHMQSQPLAVAV